MKNLSYCLLLIFLISGGNGFAQKKDPVLPHESFPVFSKNVAEKRTINVWTPPEYAQSKDSLAVLYMPDGGIQEDFPHLANTVAELIKSKKISPLILVGIENTQRRRDLTGYTAVESDKKTAPVVGGSEKFLAFIKDELIPHINKHYRTTKQKAIIGESAAGLFVVETFLTRPDIFDDYIAIDPSLWWNNQFLVKNAKELLIKLPETERKFWFAGSGTTDILPYTEELAGILKSENLPNLKWNYSPEKNEKHNTIFRATKEKALIWTFALNNAQ